MWFADTLMGFGVAAQIAGGHNGDNTALRAVF